MLDGPLVEMIVGILMGLTVFALLAASQVFWIRQVRRLGRRLIPNPLVRRWAGRALIAYAALWLYEIASFFLSRAPATTRATAETALVDGPFSWWIFGSLAGFLIVVVLRLPDYLFRAMRWLYRKIALRLAPATADPPPSAGATTRRHFLQTATTAAGTLPFVGGFYGLVFERLDVEVTRRRIHLVRLPRGFEGFRVVQLSDIHIGPFMTASDIRHVVDTAMRLKGDLIVLGGDYVTWDPTTQGAAVQALSGLRAPFGVFGCLGNHEAWTRVQDSITRLFGAQGVRILRGVSDRVWEIEDAAALLA